MKFSLLSAIIPDCLSFNPDHNCLFLRCKILLLNCKNNEIYLDAKCFLLFFALFVFL